MQLHADKVKQAIIKAQEILGKESIYAGNPDLIPVSIDQLVDVIAGESGCEVELRQVTFEGTHLFGRVERYPEKAVIDVRANLADNWKRFIATKEVVHLIIDEDEDMSPYGDQILEKLVRDGHIGVISNGDADNPPMQSELIAEVTAFEILYPLQLRSADKKALDAGTTTIKKLGIKYGLPENFVDTALSPDYLSFVLSVFRG